MRRLINVLVSFAVAAICLSSCQEVIIESPVQDEAICEYSFALSTLDESTKATLDGVVVKWTEGDYAGVVAKYPGGSSYSYSNSNTKSTIVPATSSSPAKILVKSYNQLSAGGSVYCFFPYIDKEFKTPSIDMNISSSQDGSIDEMPMASIPFVVTENVPSKTGTEVGTINMVMLGSIARFNLYSTNSDYASETVKSITFTADKDIAGSFTYDISTVNYSNPESLEISVSGSDAVSVSGDMSVGSSKTDATVVDMVIAPGSYTGIVKVVTDAAEYTYNISTAKDFDRAHIKPLNVDLGKEGARAEVQSQDYILIEEDGAFIDGGKYVFAIKDGANGKYYFISKAGSSNTLVEGGCGVSDNIITDPSTDYVFTATEDGVGFTFQNSGNSYIYCNGTNTTLNTNSTNQAIWVPSFLTSSKCYKLSVGSTSGRYIGAASATPTKVAGYANSNFKDQVAGKEGVAQYSGAISVFKLGGKTVVENPKIDNGLVEGLSAREDVHEYSVSVNNIDSDAELTIEPDGVVVFDAEIQEGAPHTIIYYLNNNLSSETAEGYINVALKNNPTVKATITVKQNAAKWDVTNNNIELKAANGSSKTFTVHSDFDWVIDTESLTGYSVSPSVFEYSNSDSQAVTVTATSANASVDDIDLGSFKIVRTEDDAEIEISVKQLNAKLATPEITNISKDTDAMTATITWKKLGNASSYSYYLTDAMGQTVENSTGNIENPDAATQSATVSIPSKDVNYLFHVKAVGDGENYFDSDYAVSDDICIETPVVGGKEYTATITSSILVINDSSQSSDYLKYAGDQTVVAKAADNSEMPMTFSISSVMPGTGGNAGKLQFKASSGTISGDGWGTIKSITADEALTVSYSGGSFTVKKTTSKAGYYDSIVIVFEK